MTNFRRFARNTGRGTGYVLGSILYLAGMGASCAAINIGSEYLNGGYTETDDSATIIDGRYSDSNAPSPFDAAGLGVVVGLITLPAAIVYGRKQESRDKQR